MFGLFKKSRSSFFGGLELEGHKLHGEAGRIQQAPLPSKVILPLAQHIGAPGKPLVEIGQRVLRGQCIADSDSFIAAPVHASISGTVVDIGLHPVPHPSGLQAMAIVIESDGLDEPVADVGWPAVDDPFSLDANTLRQRVRQAGLVGLGGAAFPSAVKLNPGSSARVDTLILNGIECEPYISCDAALMHERASEILAGARLVKQALGALECIIGVEDNAPHAARAMREVINSEGLDDITLRVAPTRYPQGGEKQLIQALTGKQVPREGLPLDIGIVVHNVGTVAAIWRAVRYAQPLVSRVLTVTGPGLKEPKNLEVRLGTPAAELIAFCGGYTEDPRLIMGGPMMGFALSTDAVPVVKATNCLLVEVKEPEPTQGVMPCIRCGECVDVCPARLLPQQLYWHARAKEFDKAQDLNLFDCIECGCCAQVCPSNIPLVQYYRYAKTEIYQTEQEKRKADIARSRHEFRQERLEREAAEKEEARRRKREALKQKQTTPEAPAETSVAKPAANDAIAAAVAKAKAEKARRLAEASADDGRESESTAASSAPTGDAIAAAIAKAKAAKAAAGNDTAADPVAAAIAKAKAAKPGAGADASSPTKTPDAIAAAIERAKAAKAAKLSNGAAPADNASASTDAVADAIAKAKAAKAAKAAKTDSASAETDDPIAAAIARAKAAKAAKAAKDDGTVAAAAAPNDAVAAAIAKARAAKARKEAGE